jgi:DNA-binding response OmpR family regulator
MDRQTVLVVESDELIRDLLTELLEGDGYAVLEAAGGAQALRLLEEHVPTVVLLDQRLTDMSGLDVLKRQRAYAPCSRIPVILMSGLTQELAGLDHGANHVLVKPFDITDLLVRVASLANDTRVAVAQA